MSGHCASTLCDQDQIQLNLLQSTNPGNYSLFAGAHEVKLDNTEGAAISNLFSSENEGLKVDIENDLLRIKHPLAKGFATKHQRCEYNSLEKSCNPGVPAIHVLNEREINPTNNKMPTSCGF